MKKVTEKDKKEFPGCGEMIYVIGTNGGKIPCGVMVTLFGKTAPYLCKECKEIPMVPNLGDKKKAKNIKYNTAFGRDFESEFSVEENNNWLRQYYKKANAAKRGYLIEGPETFPIRIWEQVDLKKEANNLSTMYELVWEHE